MMQTEDPIPEYVPAGQGVQADALPVEYVPTPHKLYDPDPAEGLYDPAGAGLHDDDVPDPGAEYDPAAHSEHHTAPPVE